MATNLAIDPELLDKAFKLSGEKAKKGAVTRALQEFVARREQRRLLTLFGKLKWNSDFNYKAGTSRPRLRQVRRSSRPASPERPPQSRWNSRCSRSY